MGAIAFLLPRQQREARQRQQQPAPSVQVDLAVAHADDTKTRSRLSGRASGWREPVRGQDDRKRERHARDGVWLPAGGSNPRARGFPDSRPTPRARDCQGGGLFPLGPPPPTASWLIAIADQGRNRSNTNPTPKYASRWRSSARVRARIRPQDPGMRPQQPGARRWAA